AERGGLTGSLPPDGGRDRLADRLEGCLDEAGGADDLGLGRPLGQECLVLGHRRLGVVVTPELNRAQEEVGRVVVALDLERTNDQRPALTLELRVSACEPGL